ncbi:MAG: N-6 DNA methylase [Candidatus Azobacteroides sp.]|nr:N-6 DNA methylase [Candidatus Azobacteroides sp.]
MANPTEDIIQYIAELNLIYKAGNATEHTYRPALKGLLEKITTGLTVTNEPKRIACGAPDYIVTRKEIPVGYIEAKDIGIDLNGKANKAQFDRYKQSLDNLIITDYLTFQLFENGEPITSVTIAKAGKTDIEPDKTQFEAFAALIHLFTGYEGQGIQTSLQLSKVMAAKARLMANIIENALNDNEKSDSNSLDGQLKGFREVLIHDITHKEFADIYAQTIAYGMFAARLNDETDDTFTRSKAAQLIPHSNPFLRKLFQYIAGYDLDERIRWVVDDLADLFNHVDINAIIKEFDKADHDPIIHFYETFLAEYDPALRKSRGVWYTPQPVVQFMVQAVDDILIRDFGLAQGLADASKIKQKQPIKQQDGRITEEEKEYHRVQILDPATGTGTFLAGVVQNIYQCFKNQQGMWQSYAHEHLLPRINGFEILMASYAMAHLKLDMLLQQTGYKYRGNERLHIYLTNSLEEARAKTEIPFAQWLSNEANEAAKIKNNTPVMVVLGNPPYSVSSQNKGHWINDLLKDYKQGLNEKNIQPLSDDYIKFIRYGQYFIEKNGEGILAYISNNSFIDGLIHRQMRKKLLETFDKIYILDLHGNSKKKEVCPDGSKDENVFDIQQGVSINIFVKTSLSTLPAKVFHCDLYGFRNNKYDFLLNNTLKSVKWEQLKFEDDNYFFVPKDFSFQKEYEKGFKIGELFPINSSGIKTQRDDASIKFTQEECNIIKNDIINLSNQELAQKYGFVDVRDWTMNEARKDLLTNSIIFNKIHYRPFDFRFMNYTGKTKGVMGYPRFETMKHFIKGENLGLITCRQQSTFDFQHVLITKNIADMCSISLQTKETGYIFPLYLYPEADKLFSDKKRNPNLNETITNALSQQTGLQFTEEKDENTNTFAPIDVLDYIYAVLHSPTYRKRYKEFLKVDFPRVPYPGNAEQFWELVKLGGKLRRLHLLEDVSPQQGMADFPIAGTNKIEKPEYFDDKVYVNNTQYFDNVPPETWNFYIGGYQPAQKWLKDRKGRTLGYDDIRHYQLIIRVLNETGEVMREVDEIREKIKHS